MKVRSANTLVLATLAMNSLAAASAIASEIKPGDDIEISYSEKTVGAGGNAWVAEKPETVRRGVIDKVEVCHGRYVNAVTFFYNGRRGTKFGGPGGDCEFFEVPKTTFINEVIVWRGDWINAIQFITEGGDDSKRFGDPAGGERVPIQDPEGGSLRQVNGKWGDYVNQLELMFALPYYVDDIDIKVDQPIKKMRFSKPRQIDVNIGDNCANPAGTVRFNNTFTKSATQSHTFRFANTTGVALSTKFKVGAPIIAEGEVEVSASTSFEFETTDGAEKTDTISRNYDYVVPKGRRIDAAFMVKEAEVKLPFSYNLYHYRNGDKRDHLPPRNYTGVYEGVLIASAETKLYEVDCRTGQRVKEIASADDIETSSSPTPEPKPAAAASGSSSAPVNRPADAPEASAPAAEIALAPPPSASDQAAVTKIAAVVTSDGAVFSHEADGYWYELSSSGEKRFTFEETDRTEDCIYLVDVSRGVLIVLNLARNVVQYASDPDAEPFDLYDIISVE
ncbi:MAG: ETX/MTX2 family pore-forming toxin [Parvularculaceae bacterium]|nr:ETX/MTX2 family pore-forming toxin [Parvularculaceae bacterium]